GALVMRGVMIGAGAALVIRFSWVTYVFGVLLLFTAVRMLFARHDNLEPEKSPLVRLTRQFFPVTDGFRNGRFMVKEGGRRFVTPLLLVLLLVESTDVLFAVDSIPAVFAVTTDPFLVYTSNVFAILGMRSLYFALAPLLSRIRFLRASLVVVLGFVGVKMLLAHIQPIPVGISLAVIATILAAGGLASALMPGRDKAPLRSPLQDEKESLAHVTVKVAARCIALIAGSTLLALGGAWLFLPGPGVLTILAGLTLLATQGLWARRFLDRARGRRS
ncbi:MAG TPA: PGPGW domain-containing protein, partial [Longimicrobiales bacterium]|nr:PGPGW domain-containing protein [Longimicrobiales bacterium]